MCSVGISFSLASSTASNDATTAKLFGFASVAFIISLCASTVTALLLTDNTVLEAIEERNTTITCWTILDHSSALAGVPRQQQLRQDVLPRPPTEPCWPDDGLFLGLFIISYGGLFALWSAFFIIGFAIRRTAGDAVGIAYLATLGGFPAIAFGLYWSYLRARRRVKKRIASLAAASPNDTIQ